MFIGHLGVALGAKRLQPDVSLGVLVLAAQFVDVLWPVMLIAGAEHVRIAPGATAVTPLDFYDYPWTHSLLMTVVWGVGFAIVYGMNTGRTKAALLCGTLVVSHWFLDAIVHRPDLPLYPSGALYGLGLWSSPIGTAIVESVLFATGLWLYLRTTTPRDATGRWGFAALIAVVILAYVLNLQGTPPPSVGALEWVALGSSTLLVAWAFWADGHRRRRAPDSGLQPAGPREPRH